MLWLIILAYIASCAFAYGFLEPYVYRREMRFWADKTQRLTNVGGPAYYYENARNKEYDPPVFMLTMLVSIIWPWTALAALGRAFSPTEPEAKPNDDTQHPT